MEPQNPAELVPLGQAATGSAYVLRNDPTALRTLQQAEGARLRRRQLEEAARAKANREEANRFITDLKLDLPTGEEYQKLVYTKLAPQVYNGTFEDYAKYKDDPMRAKLSASQRQAQFYYERDRGKKISDERLARSKAYLADTRRNGKYAVERLIALQKDDQGNYLRPSQFDPARFNEVDDDPESYDAIATTREAIKGIFTASTQADAVGGRPGSFSRSGSLTTNLFKPVRKSDGSWDVERGADGTPLVQLDNNTLQQLKTDYGFNVVLKGEMKRLGTNDEVAAAKTLLSSFGYAKETEQERYNRYPSAGRSGTNTVTVQARDGGPSFVTTGTGNDAGYSPDATRFSVYNPKKGQSEPLKYSNAQFSRVTTVGADGTTTHSANNKLALNINFDALEVGLLDPKTGESVFPSADDVQRANGNYAAALTKLQLRPENQRFSQAGLVLIGSSKKNENYGGNPQEIFAQLKEARDAAKGGDGDKYSEMMSLFGGQKVWDADAQLWAKAQSLANEQEATYRIPFSGSERQRAIQYSNGKIAPSPKTTRTLAQVQRELELAKKRNAGLRPSKVVNPDVVPQKPAAVRPQGLPGLNPFYQPQPAARSNNAGLY
ncbi:hypothetical protein [Hymenobacter koreensis]